MKRTQWLTLGFLVLGTVSGVQAQGTYVRPAAGSYAQAPLSPYLNLVRGGNPAVNYYGLVRPQVDSRNAIQQLQQQSSAAPANSGLTTDGLANSGHPVQFMNFSHYYSGNVGLGLNGRGAGAPANLRR